MRIIQKKKIHFCDTKWKVKREISVLLKEFEKKKITVTREILSLKKKEKNIFIQI